MRLKIILPVITTAAVAGILAATSPGAHAAVPNVNSNGVVGYSAMQNGNDAYFTDQVSQFGLGDPQYSVSNPRLPVNTALAAALNSLHVGGSFTEIGDFGGANVAAARVGFCGGTEAGAANAGTTIQELIIPVSDTRYDVVAVTGKFAANGGNACLGSSLPADAEAALVLENVPVSHTARLQLLFDGRHAHNGTSAGGASFIASDLTGTAANQVNRAGVFAHAGSEFYEADNGITGATGTATQSLGSTVLPDSRFPNLAAVEAHVVLNANDTATGGEVKGTLQSGKAWDVVADATQVGGVIDGAPGVFKSDHFDSFVAPGVFPVTAG